MKHKGIVIYLAIMMLVLIGMASAQNSNTAQSSNCPVMRFAIIGDRAGDHQPGIYEEILAEVERLKPDFAITVGDEIEGYTGDTIVLNQEWDEYYSIVKKLSMPLYIIASNHNITMDAAQPVFEKRVGKTYRSFHIGTVHFVLVDNSRWDSSDKLPKEQIDWIKADLEANRDASKTFVFMHKPLWYNSLASGKPDTLHTLFVKYGVDAVVAGHFHQYFSATYDNILYTCIGSSGGAIDSDPTGLGYHFAWVTVDKDGIAIAPIKINSVQAWDVVTISDMKSIDHINNNGVVINQAVPMAGDLTAPLTTIEVTLHNTMKDVSVNDTLRWNIPNGWSVEPKMMPLNLAPNGEQKVSFQVKNSGDLYPVPSVSINMPFKSEKTIIVKKDLRVDRLASCAFITKPLVIDGKLNEPIWKNPITHLFNPDGKPVEIESTYFYFAYDKGNLYFGAKCKESVMDSIRASTKTRDGAIFGEDCVGYFLQPDLKKDTVYQIYFNVLGTIFDQKISRHDGSYSGDKSWDGKYKVKTSKSKGYWNVEVMVPLDQFGIKPERGMKMGINFLRKQQHRGSPADWQVPIDYNPQSFGSLILQ